MKRDLAMKSKQIGKSKYHVHNQQNKTFFASVTCNALDRQKDRQTGRQKDRHTGRQKDIQTV